MSRLRPRVASHGHWHPPTSDDQVICFETPLASVVSDPISRGCCVAYGPRRAVPEQGGSQLHGPTARPSPTRQQLTSAPDAPRWTGHPDDAAFLQPAGNVLYQAGGQLLGG